jgi:hypothetical protein
MGIGSILLLAVSTALSSCDMGASSERAAGRSGSAVAAAGKSGDSRQDGAPRGTSPAGPATTEVR